MTPKFGSLEFWGLVALLTVPISIFFELEPKMAFVLFVTVFALLALVCTERERCANIKKIEHDTLRQLQQVREDARRWEAEMAATPSEPEMDYKTTEDADHTQYWEARKKLKTLWDFLKEDW